jgi:hypothetical protein
MKKKKGLFRDVWFPKIPKRAEAHLERSLERASQSLIVEGLFVMTYWL